MLVIISTSMEAGIALIIVAQNDFDIMSGKADFANKLVQALLANIAGRLSTVVELEVLTVCILYGSAKIDLNFGNYLFSFVTPSESHCKTTAMQLPTRLRKDPFEDCINPM